MIRNNPDVTVVIPAYKAARTIRRAIDSVLEQPDCEISVIVVIDGRFDATEEIVTSTYGDRVSLIVNPKNMGVQFSRNAGLAAAQGRWIMFLDADDFVEGPLLRGLATALQEADADLALGRMQVFHERDSSREADISLAGKTDQQLFEDWLGKGKFVSPCSVMWRTSFLRQIGGWDPDLHRQEDGEMVLRAILAGARIVHSGEGRGIYVMHHSPERLTRRNDNLISLLDVPAKLMAFPTQRFPAQVVREACASSYYNAARACYTRGRNDLGKEALKRARELGFRGHRGTDIQVALASALGLPLSAMLERGVRRLVGKAH